ncbi:MAG: 23S rRNA (adenine(2503)-C(2))-methyltransferase RlmN [Armatimonadetes bacterium]|nr:23S rRNA (adenine(2503)-C(2))-methyltransferase RlmN [Armatimonadota bacterium]
MRSLYDLTPEELTQWLAERGQPRYRARQILEWAYARRAGSFDEMTSLPKDLRTVLAQEFDLGPLPVVAEFTGRDTTKLLLKLPDGEAVECVGMRTRWGGTACVSTQVGCSIGCLFCASGADGVVRSLSAAEILRQFLTLSSQGLALRNVVFMGMGEPLLNYDAVVRAVHLFTARELMGLSPRRVTVGTAGIVPRIVSLARDVPARVELAVSLGAPEDEVRAKLMPGVARWSIKELLEACDEWTRLRGGQPVTYAYVLVAGVNDDLKLADRLAQLLGARRHLVNLLRMNPVEHTDLRPPSKERLLAFARRLEQHGLNVTIRRSRGSDIRAACGQLRRSEKLPPARPRRKKSPSSKASGRQRPSRGRRSSAGRSTSPRRPRP